MSSVLPSFKRQQLLIEFAAIKSKCPAGIYLSPGAVSPALWSGVFFVREGPYASSVLRFEIAFPPTYPTLGPTVVFATEIFHPLLVPLTTYTFAAGALDPNAAVSSNDADRLQPGSFNLGDKFPLWYGQGRDDGSARPSSMQSDPMTSLSSEARALTKDTDQSNFTWERPTLQAVLQYIKEVFEDAATLDDLPLRAAVNPNAWHAWRAHRGLPKMASRSISPASVESGRTPLSVGRTPGDWNWDGVWESRVRNGIEESTSDALLYGSKSNKSSNNIKGPFRFVKNDDEKTREIQEVMIGAMDVEAP